MSTTKFALTLQSWWTKIHTLNIKNKNIFALTENSTEQNFRPAKQNCQHVRKMCNICVHILYLYFLLKVFNNNIYKKFQLNSYHICWKECSHPFTRVDIVRPTSVKFKLSKNCSANLYGQHFSQFVNYSIHTKLFFIIHLELSA